MILIGFFVYNKTLKNKNENASEIVVGTSTIISFIQNSKIMPNSKSAINACVWSPSCSYQSDVCLQLRMFTLCFIKFIFKIQNFTNDNMQPISEVCGVAFSKKVI